MADCTCSNNHDGSGFVSGLAVGLVLGAAGAHYLQNTEEGKELFENLKEKASEVIDSVKDNPALSDKINDLQKTMDLARATINSAAEKVANATETKKPTPKKNFFQKMGATLRK